MKNFYFLLFFIFTSVAGYGYEVDNFTQRKHLESMRDALPLLNAKTNQLLAEALKEANQQEVCVSGQILTEAKLPAIFKEVKSAINTDPVAFIEEWMVDNENIDQFTPEWDIYDDPKKEREKYTRTDMIRESLVMALLGLEPSINVGGVITGVDKFGHFLSEGHDYFELYHLKGKSFSDAHKHIDELEKGYYGMANTGVYSYADVAANFNGMKFWSNLVSGENPYFTCVNGAYVQTRIFDWSDYVDHSWDEAINCSKFRKNMQKEIFQNLKDMQLQCPISKEKCLELANLNCSAFFVSPECRKFFPSKSSNCFVGENQLKVASYDKSSNRKICNVSLKEYPEEIEGFGEGVRDAIINLKVILKGIAGD